jgi:hypothetical protein
MTIKTSKQHCIIALVLLACSLGAAVPPPHVAVRNQSQAVATSTKFPQGPSSVSGIEQELLARSWIVDFGKGSVTELAGAAVSATDKVAVYAPRESEILVTDGTTTHTIAVPESLVQRRGGSDLLHWYDRTSLLLRARRDPAEHILIESSGDGGYRYTLIRFYGIGSIAIDYDVGLAVSAIDSSVQVLTRRPTHAEYKTQQEYHFPGPDVVLRDVLLVGERKLAITQLLAGDPRCSISHAHMYLIEHSTIRHNVALTLPLGTMDVLAAGPDWLVTSDRKFVSFVDYKSKTCGKFRLSEDSALRGGRIVPSRVQDHFFHIDTVCGLVSRIDVNESRCRVFIELQAK